MTAWKLISGSVIIIVPLAFLGLKISPQPFKAPRVPSENKGTIPLPEGLPDPVAGFFRKAFGENIPRVETAVVQGRGTLRVAGVTFPMRFRFVHEVGKNYKHYIETTIFGRPLMKVNEVYKNGKARLDLPMGVIENELKVDAGANQALWGEAIWFPSILLTDPRVRWEERNDTSAFLHVPFNETRQTFIVTFHPVTGLPEKMETLRYKGATAAETTPWLNFTQDWQTLNGQFLPVTGAVLWGDEKAPWFQYRIESVIFNVDVSNEF